MNYLTVYVRYNNFFLRVESNIGDQRTNQIVQNDDQMLMDCGVCDVHSLVFYETGHTLKRTLNIESADHETRRTAWFLQWSSLTVSHDNSDYQEYRFFI